MIIYVGLTSHIGCVRGRQDDQYEGKPADVMIAHITDFRTSVVDEKSLALAAYTDGEVIFHTDVGDIVSLFALDEPATGGESLLASGWRVYNELARTRPDLVKILADDWSIPRYAESAFVQSDLELSLCMYILAQNRTASFSDDHYCSISRLLASTQKG
jgi:hypothetical protein